VAHSLFEGHDAAEAADVGRGQGIARIVCAQEIIEHVQAEIVAAGTEDGAFHLGLGNEQFYGYVCALFFTF
jgi:hypothetical protein